MITIEVTQRDIDKGTRGSPYYCPVALAIAQYLGVHPDEEAQVQVITNTVNIPDLAYNRDPRVAGWLPRFQIYNLDSQVKTWIQRFDDRLPSEPFTLHLWEQGVATMTT